MSWDGFDYRKKADKKYYAAVKKQIADKEKKAARDKLLEEKRKELVETGKIKLVWDRDNYEEHS